MQSTSLLNRSLFSSSPPASLQSQVDGLVGSFVEQATDWRSLAAMTAGGLAYRTGRMAVMGLGSGSALRIASVGLGLTAEVSTFELTNRGLHSPDPRLWRWNGSGGLAQGLLQSFISFGALKGAGRLAQGENLGVQHLFQDSAMVLGHQVSASLGLAPHPTGTLAEQFLHAEATNLQLRAGMALSHGLAPEISGVERGLNLYLGTANAGAEFPRITSWLNERLRLGPALAEGPGHPPRVTESERPTLLLSKMLAASSLPPPMESETDRAPLSADFFIEKIREETEAIHREPSTWRNLLENYLRRLRILRFYASLQGPPPTVLYPMAGVDGIPSLFFPKVLGIDPWVDFPHVPSDPEYFRDRGLIVGRLDPERAGEDFSQRLEAIYKAAAREPLRHRALGKDAFDEILAQNLLNQNPSPRFVFLKGTSYLDLFYNFSDPDRKNSPHDLSSVEDAALWLADHYSAPGDHVVLWDDAAPLTGRFLESGRYELKIMDFLNPSEQTRLKGGPDWADVRVEPIFNPQAGLNLRLTDSMRIFIRKR